MSYATSPIWSGWGALNQYGVFFYFTLLLCKCCVRFPASTFYSSCFWAKTNKFKKIKYILLKNFAYNASVWICLSNEEDCSRHMPRCGHMFHDKCIHTCILRCKSEPNYGVGPPMQKTLKEAALFFISRAGRSHAPMLRPSSSHELDSILIALEFPVSI